MEAAQQRNSDDLESIAKLRLQIEEKNTKLSELTKLHDELQRTSEEQQKKAEAAAVAAVAAEAAVTQAAVQAAELDDRNKQIQQTSSEREVQLKSLLDEIKLVEGSNDAAVKELQAAAVKKLQAQHETLNAQITELSQKNFDIEIENKSLLAKNRDLRQANEILQSQVTDLGEARRNSEEFLRSSIESLRIDKDDLERELASMTSQNHRFDRIIKEAIGMVPGIINLIDERPAQEGSDSEKNETQ